MSSAPGEPGPVIEGEDRARADLYALLARMHYRGPDADLLARIARTGAVIAPEIASPLAAAWRTFAGAASTADLAAVQQEYDDLFVGTGRAEVSLYASFYLAHSGRERILAGLRTELAAMQLSRKATSREPEDHFAGLFDVMRHLIERGSQDAALQDQARFFGRFIEPSYAAFCAAVMASGRGDFYPRVAALTRAFLDVENEAMKML